MEETGPGNKRRIAAATGKVTSSPVFLLEEKNHLSIEHRKLNIEHLLGPEPVEMLNVQCSMFNEGLGRTRAKVSCIYAL